MLTVADLSADERWEAHTTLDMCRAGMLCTTETGYAAIDLLSLPFTAYRELTDRLVDHHLIAVGQPCRVPLDDGSHTTAELYITDAGERLLGKLTAALGL
ncbi:hypothetical protein [Amycolatopsis sp. 195334CR]|uniref:hypothetical protein n=1 Tax=Amycolatopsis sp. 195334CR TaxID=2814588 RepID=UPI001A8E59D8|nr:hypothetical protein [Amycolatopsis sp. 195334CR]MBN6039124.1 hypothetical protein [Amycolatopsis sp. 195334CR]